MAMSNEHFKAALKMIQVTPENYKSLNANMILYLCKVVAEAEKLCEKPSAYDNLTDEQIKERMSL
ncbi:MAG: hypothetical protein WCO26_10980 [Deltaproteobacteria bacterium]